MKLDSIDINILNILQLDATTAIQALADEVGLTNNPCWRRVKRLEESGIIQRRSAVINRKLIGLGTTAFVSIRIDSHNADWLNKFADCIENMSEIVECHRMAGDVDYLLKIIIRDLEHYDDVYQRLIASVPGLTDVSATFSMEELKAGAVIDAATARAT
ncbi:MAG: Lrp/AsnC family transcriptional regulator [Arenicella sp.]|nr:Lrp/AsnC family transcriptional regulator [Arenicella sp.]